MPEGVEGKGNGGAGDEEGNVSFSAVGALRASAVAALGRRREMSAAAPIECSGNGSSTLTARSHALYTSPHGFRTSFHIAMGTTLLSPSHSWKVPSIPGNFIRKAHSGSEIDSRNTNVQKTMHSTCRSFIYSA